MIKSKNTLYHSRGLSLCALFLTLLLTHSQSHASKPIASLLVTGDKTVIGDGKKARLLLRSALLPRAVLVLTEGEEQKVIEELKLSSFSACRDEACQIEVGKELSANILLKLDIVRFDRNCRLYLTESDPAEAVSKKVSKSTQPCTDSGIEKGILQVTAALFEQPTIKELGAQIATLTKDLEKTKGQLATCMGPPLDQRLPTCDASSKSLAEGNYCLSPRTGARWHKSKELVSHKSTWIDQNKVAWLDFTDALEHPDQYPENSLYAYSVSPASATRTCTVRGARVATCSELSEAIRNDLGVFRQRIYNPKIGAYLMCMHRENEQDPNKLAMYGYDWEEDRIRPVIDLGEGPRGVAFCVKDTL